MFNFQRITIAVIAGVFVLSALIYGSYRQFGHDNNPPDSDGSVICTQEALLCPDGSYVGRTGPKCEFRACEDQPYFEGILRQDPGSFALMLPAPSGITGEVSYRMPLVIKVTNVLGQFVGKKIRVYGAFTTGATFAVDHLELSGDAALGEAGIGESIFINGVFVTVNKIVNDSRCPQGVQCISAGSFKANVSLKSNTDKETLDMLLNSAPHSFDSFQISLIGAAPARVSGSDIDPKDYVLTFRVRENKPLPADSEAPAAGICEFFQAQRVAAIRINQSVPSPRCLNVRADQMLKIHNSAPDTASLWFGDNKEFAFSIAPGGDYLINMPLINLLAPGVHVLHGLPYAGPEIWVRQSN